MDVEESANIWNFKYPLQPAIAIKISNVPETAKDTPGKAYWILSKHIRIIHLIYNTISIEAN